MGRNKLVILWVEDDDNDVLLLQRAFKKAGIAPVHICTNGEDAVRYLQGQPPYEDRQRYPVPTLVVTDINMPRASGFDLLKWIRNHPDCHVVPVVLFSGSAESHDISRAYQLGANAFFQKPARLENVVDLVGNILSYWREAHPPDPPQKAV
jgi:CheY-like chemotaxis protein